MRVRIKESSFCLHALRATLASFPDGGGQVDAGPRFAYADGKPLDRPRQLWCVEQGVGRIVDIQTELFTFDSCKMAGDQAILPVSFIS